MDTTKELIPEFQNFLNNSSDAESLYIGEDLALFFLKTMVEFDFIYNHIEKPYMRENFDFECHLKSMSESIKKDQIADNLAKGYLLAQYKGQVFVVNGALRRKGRSVEKAIREASLEGSVIGFVENTAVNINLIRQVYKNKALVIKTSTIGTDDKKLVSVLYNSEIVDKQTLDYINNTINNLEMRSISGVGELQQLLITGQFLFPRLLSTERPDRSIMALSAGKVVIMLEGSPMALIAPSTFHDFMKTVDEKFLLPIPSFFLLALRYLAFTLSLTAPSIYVVCVAYNPEIFRIQLALSIAASRKNVPYSSFIEVLFMLLMMEFLVEASLRLPKTVGQAATTVGGIILGQAVTQANLVSDIMIILIAAVAISNFVIPNIMMNSTLRVLKYYVLILSLFGGLIGFLCAVMSIPCYIASIDNIRRPYFKPLYQSISGAKSFLRKGR